LSCLDDLKNLLYRNEYPKYFVREKIDIFLNSQGNFNLDAILCLNYTSPRIEYYARKLITKMKLMLPNIHVSLALKTVKISQLFSKSAKGPEESKIETANTNYHFICPCKSDYVGRCKKPLDHRIKEHFRSTKDSDNHIHNHIKSCPHYMKKN
jgi:hypothetical protein